MLRCDACIESDETPDPKSFKEKLKVARTKVKQ